MHAVFVRNHAAAGMRFFTAVFVRQARVHDITTIRAVANRRIGVAVIHVRTEFSLHLDSHFLEPVLSPGASC